MGKLIAIYGTNNIGKTIQSQLLAKRLNKDGKKVKLIKYPIYKLKPSGPFLNIILRSGTKQNITEEELQMWFVLNRFQYEKELTRLLNKYDVVLCEDYIGTGIAWGITKAVNKKWLETINKPLRKENFSLLLDGARNQESKEKGHIHEESEKLISKCRKMYLQLAKEYGWTVIKREKEIAKTADKIYGAVRENC